MQRARELREETVLVWPGGRPARICICPPGSRTSGWAYPAYNPKARFNEDVCAIGPAGLVHCAVRWLEQ